MSFSVANRNSTRGLVLPSVGQSVGPLVTRFFTVENASIMFDKCFPKPLEGGRRASATLTPGSQTKLHERA